MVCRCALITALLILAIPASTSFATDATFRVPPLDRDAALDEDTRAFGTPGAPRFAIAFETFLTPTNSGTLKSLPDGTVRWTLKIEASGALNLKGIGDSTCIPARIASSRGRPVSGDYDNFRLNRAMFRP